MKVDKGCSFVSCAVGTVLCKKIRTSQSALQSKFTSTSASPTLRSPRENGNLVKADRWLQILSSKKDYYYTKYIDMLEELPEVVIRSLLKYLDTQSTLSLRLTSTTTSDWVTTKDFIKNLKVHITSNEDIIYWITKHELLSSENICNCWNKFLFQQNLKEHNQLILTQFCTTWNQLEKLELKTCSAHKDDALWKMLSQLRNLKTLTIQDLDISNCCEESVPEVGQANLFLKLNTFSVQKLSFLNPVDLRVWERIVNLLAVEHANFITIPKPHYMGLDNWVTWPQVKALQWVLITEPMLHSLGSFKDRKICISVVHLVPIHFGRLVERCMTMNLSGCNFYFSNVHSNHVKYVFLLSGAEQEDDFLGRILSICEKIDDRRPLNKWTALEELSIKTSRCDVRNSYEGELIFPQLKKIEIDFDSALKNDPEFAALHRIIALLLKVKREQVEEVVLKWGQFGHDTPQNVVDLHQIKENFSSLKKLVVVSDGITKKIF